MHTAALYLAPILGAEKSKVPFFIAGGLLVAWALILSLVIGLRRPEFPDNLPAERIVIAISVVLVLAATSTAVITSGSSSSAGEAQAAAQAPATGTESAPAASTPGSSPKATTGTPAPPSSPAAATRLALAANPSGLLSYNTKQLNTHAGQVTINFTNMSPVEHNVTIEQGRKILGETPTFKGASKSLTLNLKPGTYKFFCSVPGHRQAGMEGTLTVS